MKKPLVALAFVLFSIVFAIGQGCKMYSYDQWKAKLSFCVPTIWSIDDIFNGYILFTLPEANVPGKKPWFVRLDAINRPDLKSASECHKWYLERTIQGPAMQLQYTDIKASTSVAFKTDSGLIGSKSVITYTMPDYTPQHIVYGFQIDDIVQCYVLQTLQSDVDGPKSVDDALKTLKLVKKTSHGK